MRGASACSSCVRPLATARKRRVDRPSGDFFSLWRDAPTGGAKPQALVTAVWPGGRGIRATASTLHRKGSWRVVCRPWRALVSVRGALACGSCVPVLAVARKRRVDRPFGDFFSLWRDAPTGGARYRGTGGGTRQVERSSPEAPPACRLSTGASAGEREGRIGVRFVRAGARHTRHTARKEGFRCIPLDVASSGAPGTADPRTGAGPARGRAVAPRN